MEFNQQFHSLAGATRQTFFAVREMCLRLMTDFQVIVSELTSVLSPNYGSLIGSRLMTLLPRIELICDFTESWLRAGVFLSESFRVTELVAKFLAQHQVPHADFHLLASGLRLICAALAACPTDQGHDLAVQLCQSGVLPLVRMSGSQLLDSVLTRHVLILECSAGRYPTLLAYLDLCAEAAAQLKRHCSTGMERMVFSGVLFVFQEVFCVFQRWSYASSSQSISIGKSACLLFSSSLHSLLCFAAEKCLELILEVMSAPLDSDE